MLAPCYLVHGGEPLQTEEFVAEIRDIANKEGYTCSEVFEVNAQFDWEQLLSKCQNRDLFAGRSLIELRLQSSISKQGSLALENILSDHNDDLTLLVRAEKLTPASLKSKWADHLRQKGKIFVAKPLDISKWPQWIKLRLNKAGYEAADDVIQAFTHSFIGNQIAAIQCIEKIKLAVPKGILSLKQAEEYLHDSTRFSVYDLADYAISGNIYRTFETFKSLKGVGTEPVLLLWCITRELRNLIQIKHDTSRGTSLQSSSQRLGIWSQRIPLIQKALERLSASELDEMLIFSKTVDAMAKGVSPGNVWEPLLSICLMLAGSKTLTMEELNI